MKQAKQAGVPYLHPKALVDAGAIIGGGTRVWAFAHVLSGAVVGEDCNICDHTFVEGGVRVGNRVTLKCGVYLWDGLVLEDDVFVGPGATVTNDFRPRSQQHLDRYPTTTLCQGCSIGANATILPGLRVGRFAMIGAGSVVTHDVPDYALVVGNPARFAAWLCRCGRKLVDDGSGREFGCICGRSFALNQRVLQELTVDSDAGSETRARS